MEFPLKGKPPLPHVTSRKASRHQHQKPTNQQPSHNEDNHKKSTLLQCQTRSRETRPHPKDRRYNPQVNGHRQRHKPVTRQDEPTHYDECNEQDRRGKCEAQTLSNVDPEVQNMFLDVKTDMVCIHSSTNI